jgi:hypothetical protein
MLNFIVLCHVRIGTYTVGEIIANFGTLSVIVKKSGNLVDSKIAAWRCRK